MNAELTKIKKDHKSDEYVTVPPVDIYETDNEYVLKAEMPGVTKEDIEITLNDKELEIKGKINGENQENNLKYSEYKLFNYHRKFKVGGGIDNNALSATLENGLLNLVLQKSEAVKPRKIEVKVEH